MELLLHLTHLVPMVPGNGLGLSACQSAYIAILNGRSCQNWDSGIHAYGVGAQMTSGGVII